MSERPGLLDTSVFIAGESGRELATDRLPDVTAISVVTVAELNVGVLAAKDTATRARRLATFEAATAIEPLPITPTVAHQWAALRVFLAEAGHRVNVNDLWIAAIAAANRMDVVTQDGDFELIAEVGGPAVVRV